MRIRTSPTRLPITSACGSVPKGATMAIIKQGTFKAPEDVWNMQCVDWQRLNGHWRNQVEAANHLASWLVDTCSWSLIEHDLRSAPDRSDFPVWTHGEQHAELGRLYWNWFHAGYDGMLIFGDEPDFGGTIRWDDGETVHILGDIGVVAVSTFALCVKQLRAHDLWVSVLDDHTQFVIEPLVSLTDIRAEQWGAVSA